MLDVTFILRLREDLGFDLDKVTIITTNPDSTIPVAEANTAGLAEAGLEVGTFTFDIGTQDSQSLSRV